MQKGGDETGYLIQHYKGMYRLLCPYDLKSKDYNKKLNDLYEDVDIYIDCYHKIKIFYYGKSILEVYIPSLIRGHNIIKSINELNNDIIQYIQEGDSEVIFRFHAKHMKLLEPILKPKTNGASISPFSSRNLPKNKNFRIPENELTQYKDIIQNIPKKRILDITHITTSYLKTLVTKKYSWENIKADMKQKGLKGKEYIYSIKKWDNYIKYLKENINESKN